MLFTAYNSGSIEFYIILAVTFITTNIMMGLSLGVANDLIQKWLSTLGHPISLPRPWISSLLTSFIVSFLWSIFYFAQNSVWPANIISFISMLISYFLILKSNSTKKKMAYALTSTIAMSIIFVALLSTMAYALS